MKRFGWAAAILMFIFAGVFFFQARSMISSFEESREAAYILLVRVYAVLTPFALTVGVLLSLLAQRVDSLLRAQNARIEELERKISDDRSSG
jgi:hypothetical protein